jgi:putative transposase
MMKHLGQRYVQYVNRTYRRSGTLWEGRFRSCLAQDDRYVLACYRYIELNPVRANMVKHPGEYPWSSYAAKGQGKADRLLTSHPQYVSLGLEPAARRRGYRGLFRAHMEPRLIDEIRSATNGNFVLGNDRFKDDTAQVLGRRVTPGNPGRPGGKAAPT